MTITTHIPLGIDTTSRSLGKAIIEAPASVLSFVRHWHAKSIERRNAAKLPDHLRLDIGEIDHLPPHTQSLGETEPTSYQDRLEQMWMR